MWHHHRNQTCPQAFTIVIICEDVLFSLPFSVKPSSYSLQQWAKHHHHDHQKEQSSVPSGANLTTAEREPDELAFVSSCQRGIIVVVDCVDICDKLSTERGHVDDGEPFVCPTERIISHCFWFIMGFGLMSVVPVLYKRGAVCNPMLFQSGRHIAQFGDYRNRKEILERVQFIRTKRLQLYRSAFLSPRWGAYTQFERTPSNVPSIRAWIRLSISEWNQIQTL